MGRRWLEAACQPKRASLRTRRCYEIVNGTLGAATVGGEPAGEAKCGDEPMAGLGLGVGFRRVRAAARADRAGARAPLGATYALGRRARDTYARTLPTAVVHGAGKD